jgi:hypothetical protein
VSTAREKGVGVQIKQIMPADGWYIIRRDFTSSELPDRERVWHYPLCAFALVEGGDGDTWIEAVEVIGSEITLAGDLSDGYYTLVRGDEDLERELGHQHMLWRTKPWAREAEEGGD